ncbi:MAG: addiction module toxin RelE [Candidatus Omnitrophica bacterium CG11_big_fil_rev_8_21_14_0_20_45_26]|uniref:Addiction module toxin RelE n=1 Tax=Candidatus Abzuiibacterium crystallinum TaxID=1974748 RepID=A0A2H0LP57_9BACT|nr:MAG: addiction module toxin RelE [Candidatus Omnitrophica bacterium CG11_big_fil_rev_8_21_14_0_20_45_26]PIW63645.1 MAG: addiction module toxin RelE [Candidatus Omnitrophica bacterium CG12_big_fil_rev_8_21_14_0_65_45_16]
MARSLRLQFPGAYYHVFSRGNEKREIVREEYDYRMFLSILVECAEKDEVVIYAYCIMPNHFHLLIQTKQANLAVFMKRLIGTYTMRFNYRHERVGHLFQGRYKSIVIDKDTYLLELSRYIHLNPCKAKLVDNPVDYVWSSMRYFVRDEPPSFLGSLEIMNQFQSPVDYQTFVHKGLITNINPLQNAVGNGILGSQEFVQRLGVRSGT